MGGLRGGCGDDQRLRVRQPHILDREDEDVSEALEGVFRTEGIELRLGRQVVRVSGRAGELAVELDDGAILRGSHVLVAVGRTPNTGGLDCDRADQTLDVGAAPDRSRALLEKRALVVDAGGEAVASARGVLHDVELALRQVADLPSCVKRRDVELVQKDVEERQLLMRIRLMTRELEG